MTKSIALVPAGKRFATPCAMRSWTAPIATIVGAFVVLGITAVGGCKTDPDPKNDGRPSLSANTEVSAPIAPRSARPEPTVSAAPIPKAQVEAALNPRKRPAYDGPVGVVEGTIRIKGDAPPEVSLQLPPSCAGAAQTYGRLFREGTNRAAADVLVAVTGYDSYVPEKEEAETVTIDACAYSHRTIALTFGQRLEVRNEDPKNSFIPILHGSRYTAFMVAVPKGDPVKLYPHRVGQYELADNMNRRWMSADVFVLKFPTHAVTGLDGKYRIEGVPVGEVTVNALLPSTNATVEKKVEVKDGKSTIVDLVLEFDAESYEGKTQPRPLSPSASAPHPKAPIVK